MRVVAMDGLMLDVEPVDSVTGRSRTLERRRAPEPLPVGLAGAVEIG